MRSFAHILHHLKTVKQQSRLPIFVDYQFLGFRLFTARWRHNERDGVSNHRRLDCVHNRLFRRRSKKTSKLGVTGLCYGNSPVTGKFPTQRAGQRVSNAENISVWWRHNGKVMTTKIDQKILPVGNFSCEVIYGKTNPCMFLHMRKLQCRVFSLYWSK